MKTLRIILLGTMVLLFFWNGGIVQALDIMDGKALYQDVVRYSGFSPHMTVNPGDIKTAKWMAEEMKKANLEVELQTWKLRQFFINKSELMVDGQEVETFPFWYPKSTGEEPAKGPLVLMTKESRPEDLKSRIAFVTRREAGADLYYQGVNPFAQKAVESGALGLVVTVVNAAGQLAAINAREPFHQTPLPLPCVIVAMKDERQLIAAAKAGETASILIEGKDLEDAESSNVIGRLKRGPRWIVVTTPTSGWFGCAGERGRVLPYF